MDQTLGDREEHKHLPRKLRQTRSTPHLLLRDIKEACQGTVVSWGVGFGLALLKKLTSRLSLEDTRAARICISQPSLTRRSVGFDSPVPE